MLKNFFTHYLNILEKSGFNTPLISYLSHNYTYKDILSISQKFIEEIRYFDNSSSPIAIELNRSPEYYAALLACINLGRPFIPLDNRYPENLKQHIFHQTCARVLISSENKKPKFQQLNNSMLVNNEFDDIFAIFYTSGSTNVPKGVKLSYSSIENRFNWMWDLFPYNNHEKQLFKANTIFIDSLWECFGAFLKGIPTFIADSDLVNEPLDLLNVCYEQHITRITVVPSYLKAMLSTGITDSEFKDKTKNIDYWIVSGERFDNALAKQLFTLNPNSKILNLYGSTEVMGDVTYHLVNKNSFIHENVPIGINILNNDIKIIDNNKRPITDNDTPGDIVVSGIHVTPGYVDETANVNVFIDMNLDGDVKRWYVTGDTGFIYNNYLVYIGRKDRIVKINGARANLDIIESIIREQTSIYEAAVAQDEQNNVCVFIVLKQNTSILEYELKEYINMKYIGLPITPIFYIRDILPKTISGKINYIQLKESIKHNLIENSNDSQADIHTLKKIVEKILATSEIATSDNLFNLGLHSLNAVQLAGIIRKTFKKGIKIKQIFEKPTIKDIYDMLFVD